MAARRCHLSYSLLPPAFLLSRRARTRGLHACVTAASSGTSPKPKKSSKEKLWQFEGSYSVASAKLVRGAHRNTAQSGFHMCAYPFKNTRTSNLAMYAQCGGVAIIGFDARGKGTQPRRSAILYYQANQGRRSKKRNVLNVCGGGPFLLEPNCPNHLHCSLSLLDVRVARHCVIADALTVRFVRPFSSISSPAASSPSVSTSVAALRRMRFKASYGHCMITTISATIDMCIQFQSNFMLHYMSANSLFSPWRGIST